MNSNKHTIWMTGSLAFAGALLAATHSVAVDPAHLYSRGFGSNNIDAGYAVAVDGSNNLIVAGEFHNTIDFGGGPLTSIGSYDIFVAKFDSHGTHVWSLRAGDINFERLWDVAVDASGNVFVTGEFSGSVDFGGGSLVSAGAGDVFLVKYSAVGAHIWSRRFGGAYTDVGQGVAVNSVGGVIVAGSFGQTVDFGGGGLISTGGRDMFVAQFDASGTHQWSLHGGGADDDRALGVAVDDSDHVVVAGYFRGIANFGGADLNGFSISAFLAKYDGAGAHQWSKVADGDVANAVALDDAGNIFLTGNTTNNILLAKYGPDGALLWAEETGSPYYDTGYDVAVDGTGHAIVTGDWAHWFTINNTTYLDSHFWIAKYDTDGAQRWSGYYGSGSNDEGYSVAVDGLDNVWVTGYFSGTASFGGAALDHADGPDVLLVKYGFSPAPPVITSIADVANDQGRQVQIDFTASGHDQPAGAPPVVRYEAYRRLDDALAVAPPPDAGASTRALFDQGWIEVGWIDATGAGEYSMNAETAADSTVTAGPYLSAFFIRAATSIPSTFHDSPPDSGYSVDNLAPPAPENLVHMSGQLTWQASSAADFDYFTVYGSNTNSFGAATLVDYTVAPAADVTGSPYVFYFVTATDFSGNEGTPAFMNTLSGAGGTPRSYVLSVSNYPNPFNPRTTVRYTVPSHGRVTVAIYDARGARVATLVDHEERAVGAYATAWDGRNYDGVRVPSGVYFARIEQVGATRTKKMVLLK